MVLKYIYLDKRYNHKYLECVFDLSTEDHDEPIEASEEKNDDNEPVRHDVVASLHLSKDVLLLFL